MNAARRTEIDAIKLRVSMTTKTTDELQQILLRRNPANTRQFAYSKAVRNAAYAVLRYRLRGQMTAREASILRELRFIRTQPPESSAPSVAPGFARCMDVGGTDASHHSATLARMVKRGWVERRRRGYRITDAGLIALEESHV